MGAVQTNLIYAALAGLTLILGAGYTLWMYKRTIFGVITNPHVADMKDVNISEFLVLLLLGIAVIYMGVYPEVFVAKMQVGVRDVMHYAMQSKLK